MRSITGSSTTPTEQRNIKQILTHPTRVEILNTLRYHRLPANEIADLLNIRYTEVLRHLGALRNAGFIKAHPVGHVVYYGITDPRLAEMCSVLYRLWSSELANHTSARQAATT